LLCHSCILWRENNEVRETIDFGVQNETVSNRPTLAVISAFFSAHLLQRAHMEICTVNENLLTSTHTMRSLGDNQLTPFDRPKMP
jgi:hypothetical protein